MTTSSPSRLWSERALDVDSLRALLLSGRSEQVELLPEDVSTRRLADTLSALANSSGGHVILGAPSGLADCAGAQTKTRVSADLSDPPLLLPDPSAIPLDGRVYLDIAVPPSLARVHSIGGRFLVRTRSGQRALGPTQVRQLLAERAETAFERLVPLGATMADFDEQRAAEYVRVHVGADSEPIASLVRCGCLSAAGSQVLPTYAGVLLFGRDSNLHCPSSEIVAVRYAGSTMSDEFVREEIRETLPDQIRRAEAFLTSNIRRGVHIRALTRAEAPEYPLEAVREALVNAVAHRDYSIRGDCIRVIMFSDRIEFYSPGRLPGHITVQNIQDERFSRNPAIVRVLSDMGFIERLGYGIDRMLKRMAESGLPRPMFQETAGGFRVTLSGHGDRFVATSGQAHRWALLNLNERQQQAMAHLAENGRITNRDYQELCPDVSAETIRRDLSDLVSRGLLLRIGDKRATYYILK